jgi:small subunit ribosomal protein S6
VKNSVYESAILVNAALDDQQIESILSKVKEFITNNGGKIREFDNWGRKRLAYPVEKSKIGYYAIYTFDAPGDIVAKLERMYTLDEQILRFLTLKLDNDALEQLEKNKAVSNKLNDDSAAKITDANTKSDKAAKNEDNGN